MTNTVDRLTKEKRRRTKKNGVFKRLEMRSVNRFYKKLLIELNHLDEYDFDIEFFNKSILVSVASRVSQKWFLLQIYFDDIANGIENPLVFLTLLQNAQYLSSIHGELKILFKDGVNFLNDCAMTDVVHHD